MRLEHVSVPASSWESGHNAFLALPETTKEVLTDPVIEMKIFLLTVCGKSPYTLSQIFLEDTEWIRNRLLHVAPNLFSEYVLLTVTGAVFYMAAVEVYPADELRRYFGGNK